MKSYALSAPVDGSADSTETWRDGKRYLWLL
ncbi:MAG: hypothetical protein QOD82_1467, partial [Pseudonocardiales bacterium]|nr:hypothetical protein [Pseudonocardiales bacterium]